MYIDELPIYETNPEPQADLTVSLSESLVKSLNQIADEYNIAADRLVESAIYHWLLRGHEDRVLW